MESKAQVARMNWQEARTTAKEDISEGIDKIYDWICKMIEENAKNKNFMNPITIHHESGSKNLIFEAKKLSCPDFYINGLLEKVPVSIIFEALEERFEKEDDFRVEHTTKRTLFGVKNVFTLTIL